MFFLELPKSPQIRGNFASLRSASAGMTNCGGRRRGVSVYCILYFGDLHGAQPFCHLRR